MPLSFFDQPHDSNLETLSFLGPSELEKKRLVCAKFNFLALSNQLWNAFLKEPFRIYDSKMQGEARAIYIKHPECRLPKFVREDQHGRSWFAKRMKLETQKYLERKAPDRSALPIHRQLKPLRMNLQTASSLIQANLVSIERAGRLNDTERAKLRVTKELLLANYISFEEAMEMQFSGEEGDKIQSAAALLIANRISLEEVKMLTFEEAYNLGRVAPLVISGNIALNEGRRLTREESENLHAATTLVATGKLTVSDAKQLSLSDSQRLHLKEAAALIQDGILTLQEAVNLTNRERISVCDLKPLIQNNLLTVAEAKRLTTMELLNLHKVMPLILSERLTIREAKRLSEQECKNLFCLEPLITAGELPIAEAKALNIPDGLGEPLHLLAPLILKGFFLWEDVINLDAAQAINLQFLAALTGRRDMHISEDDIGIALQEPALTKVQGAENKPEMMPYRQAVPASGPPI